MIGQFNIFTQSLDFSDRSVGVGISGGINSAAVLCWLADLPEDRKPKKLGLIYCHMREHSPGTAKFSIELMRYARNHFKNVVCRIVRASVLDYFEAEKFIPHPTLSPCTADLKIAKIADFYISEGITTDLIGYVRGEKRRIKRQQAKAASKGSKQILSYEYPIQDFDDEKCIAICMERIGWVPPIYSLKHPNGKRIFAHNNCLPCKNMEVKNLESVREHFPEYYARAMKLAHDIGGYWGRDKEGGSCATCEF